MHRFFSVSWGREDFGSEIFVEPKKFLAKSDNPETDRYSAAMTTKSPTNTQQHSKQRNLFWISYSSVKPTKKEKTDEIQHPKLFHERDGVAFMELAHSPLLRSFAYEDFIHFYPDHQTPIEAYPKVSADDALALTTRLPLDDEPAPAPNSGIKHRKIIPASNNGLERIIFEEFKKNYFESFSRNAMRLKESAIKLLRKKSEQHLWKELHFQVNAHDYEDGQIHGAVDLHIIRPGDVQRAEPPPYTVAFLVCVRHLGELDCSLVASFGIDGYGTLFWNRILRKRFGEIFRESLTFPRFVMAKLTYRKPIPERLTTPRFADCADNIEVEILANGEVEGSN